MAEAYEQVSADTLRKHVRRDDVLDSMVLALAAQREAGRCVPADPGPDVPRIYDPSTPALTASP